MPTKRSFSLFYLCLLFLGAFFLLPVADSVFANSVVNTKHNLSWSGPGDVRSTSEERICIFCHTPHHANDVTPLWSRSIKTGGYTLYTSSTLKAVPGQPTGYSRLCLSCHDGTVALGLLHGATTPIPFTFGISGRPSDLGTDLGNDHPISFAYTSTLASANGELKLPVDLPLEIKLDEYQNLQCTSCHNPHSDPYGMFLVMANNTSQLCTACHNKTGWAASTHINVTAADVSGCVNCHDPHTAGGSQRLLKSVEEQTCLTCHQAGSGVAGAKDIKTPITRASHHPVESAVGVHEPTEVLPAAQFHVECTDCHNPHQANGTTASAPSVNGRLKGVKGVKITNVVTSVAQYEYEVCFRCHGDSSFMSKNVVTRQIEDGNKRFCFDPVNPSFHPVAAVGKGTNVPSLKEGYTTASFIYCTDCHNNDKSVKAGGTGANGPHGSDSSPLLIARYERTYPQTYDVTKYALCFRCHDSNVIMFGNPRASAFSAHWKHVQQFSVPCASCHDPHGIPQADGGTTSANAHLINFAAHVTGSYNSVARSCTVSCHHNPGGTKSY